VVEFLVVLVALALVVAIIAAPLRRRAADQAASTPSVLADLEAAKDAKYREIRDAALDHETGKLSDADFAELDATLRSEAVEILRALDEARGR
jgi:hypothetical protein